MTVRELIEKLLETNPKALVVLRDIKDLAEADLHSVDTEPEGTLVMLWGDFQ